MPRLNASAYTKRLILMGFHNQAFNSIRLQSTEIPAQAFRKPKRVSITVPESVYAYLLKRSDEEGRSLSNLAANLLEIAARQQER
jgi:hypothetical protein